MKLRLAIISFILITALLVNAHEFWLQPEKFFYQPGDTLKVNFNVGENFIAEPWKVNLSRIQKIELHQLGNATDLKPFVKEGDKKNLSIALKNEGTHVLVMQSNNASIELPADKFNEYLKEEGLEEALQYREQHGMLEKPGKENYARYTKTIFQVGEKKDATYKKSMGLPVEIFIEKNPGSIKVGEMVKFKVMFNNNPLFGAKVTVWNRFENRTTIQPVYTLKDGTIEARISNKGPWMVSVVKMIPSEDKTADWQSYWGSLVFGVQ